MEAHSNLFTFIHKYSNCIKCERIQNDFTPIWKNLRSLLMRWTLMVDLKQALNIIRSQKNLPEEMSSLQPNTPFLNSLTLATLP